MYFFVSDIGTVKLLIVYTRKPSWLFMCLRMTDFNVWISNTDGCPCPPLKPHSHRPKVKIFLDVFSVFFDRYQPVGKDPNTSLMVHSHRLRPTQRPRLAPIKFERSNEIERKNFQVLPKNWCHQSGYLTLTLFSDLGFLDFKGFFKIFFQVRNFVSCLHCSLLSIAAASAIIAVPIPP